jgi:hypothetical protein
MIARLLGIKTDSLSLLLRSPKTVPVLFQKVNPQVNPLAGLGYRLIPDAR